MKDNTTLRKPLFKNIYLLIIAAWLFTISFIVSNYWAYNSTPLKVQQGFEHYLTEREFVFEGLINDTAKLSVLLNENADKSALQLDDADFGIFLFKETDSGTIHSIYWNTFSMNLSPSDLNGPDGYYPFNGSNGFFELLKKTISKNGSTYILAGLVPIKWKYFIENKYISNSFAYSNSSLKDKYFIASGNKGFPVYNSKNIPVFRLEQYRQANNSQPNSLAIALMLMAVAFVLIFINSTINEVAVRQGFYHGLAWLIVVVVFIRLITYWLPIPFNFRSYELFSPLVYASSVLHSSLGDLLINVLLFFWITFFIKYRYQERVAKEQNYWYNKYKKIIGAAFLFLFAFLTINMLTIVCSLVIDSKIPLNVTDFFHLNIYTLVTFFILTFIILSYYNLSYFLLLPAINAGLDMLWRIVILVASGLLIISLQFTPDFIYIKLASLVWLVLYCFILEFRKEDLPKALVSSPYFLFWLMFFAASITMIIRGIDSRDTEQKKWFAQSLAERSDNTGKNLLNMAISNFSDFFLEDNFHRLQSPDDNRFIKDSLMANNFSGFLNNYKYQIYTFDSAQQPLYNKDSMSFNALNAFTGTMSKHSDIPNLYVYEPKEKQFEYIFREKIIARQTQQTLGYIFMIIYPKSTSSNDLSNGLLKDASFMSDEAPQTYSYAIYKNRHLIKNNDAYDFSDSIAVAQVPKGDYKEVNNSQTKELWYNAGNNVVIVVIQKRNDFVSALTLFAYLFSSFVAFIVLLKIIGFLFQSRFKWAVIKKAFKFKIRLQIHATIIFISAFSFIIIGISTISFFIMRFNKSNQEKLTENVQILVNEIQQSIDNNLPFALKMPNDLDNFFSKNGIDKIVIELANMNKQEVNLYDLRGMLKASSQPYIFNKNIVSNKMQPNAYYQLHYKHRIKVLQNEKIGKFQYLSIYVPIYDKENNTIAYLNVPFLNSQNELQQEISSFLVTVINLNALIFLLAGAIAALLTLRITRSFSVIKDKMRKINVGMENEEISWNRNDEIGDLVKEYNIMVRKLNDSIKALAQSEREGAWQEMAQQVAHEIKNPLTPMKLSLQFLQRAADNNADNIVELAKKVPNMLIEQINQLANIANDFSHFAKIQNIKPEHFKVSEILESLIMLNQAQHNVNITYTKPAIPNIINADKAQINRLFTNLIKNGIEASSKNKIIEIIITEERIENQVLIAIQDNGEGISKQEASKLFEPNFTTKTSGTGLGLAICKGIVENAGGQIWFESVKDNGATFYVSLPVVSVAEEEHI